MSGLVPSNRNRGLARHGFNDLYGMFDDFFRDMTPFNNRLLRQSTFRLDVQDNDNEYKVEAELPGADKKDISVDMTDGRLTISVVHDEEKETKDKNYIHRERVSGSMRRSVYLHDAKDEGIKARFKNGILEVVVPKEADAKKNRPIEIE
ncbi:MAG: Hsp20/alpha crystallin family protein [Christensenellales bacterium]|jgi:HSP20 family protein